MDRDILVNYNICLFHSRLPGNSLTMRSRAAALREPRSWRRQPEEGEGGMSGTPRIQVLVIAALAAFAAMAGPAVASEGAMPPLVHDIGISLLLAGGLAVVCARLKIPSIAAFLLAGVLVGPLVLRQVTDPDNIDTIAQLGFVLLLFMIGLELDVRGIVASGRTIIVAGLLQYPLSALFGYAVAYLLSLAGLGGSLLASGLAPFYVGIVIAGSSTLQVVKLFQEHFELDTQPGRIALALLIFQDIWAIIVTLVQPNLGHLSVTPILMSFAGIGILAVIAVVVSRFLVTVAFRWISKVPELILLGAVSWCFAVVMVGISLDEITGVFGVNLHLAVGSGMAALIAGATIANLPFSIEIVTKVGVVKDFFVTLFFVGLGISIPAIQGWDVPVLAIAIAIIAILARQVVFFPLLYFLGVDQRNSEVASIRLAQISEFGLVITFLGVQQGHLSPELNSAIILAFVATALATTPLYEQAYALHARLKPLLTRIGFKEPPAAEEEAADGHEIAILGLHRDASSLLHEITAVHPDFVSKVLVVDFNVALHERIKQLGFDVEYGDISNTETLVHAGVDKARIIVCTISDDLLRGITNRDLVMALRKINPGAIIIANAVDIKAYDEVYAAGADFVYMARLEVARTLSDLLGHAMQNRLSEYKKEKLEELGSLSARKEVLS